MSPKSNIVQNHSMNYITDLIYFSVELNADATIDFSSLRWLEEDTTHSQDIKNDVQIYLAIGGWERCKHFAEACKSVESRGKLIASLVELCKTHRFQGIDYDWEFPKNGDELALYNALIVETKTAFKEHELKVSVALSPWQVLSEEACAALDRIHLMTYDFPGEHSTQEKSEHAVNTLLERGVPADKIYMGVPFYGRLVKDSDKAMVYNQLKEKYDLQEDLDEIDGYYFNGPKTIAAKTEFALEKKLGGIMIWELGQDVEDDSSLLKAIYNTVKGK